MLRRLFFLPRQLPLAVLLATCCSAGAHAAPLSEVVRDVLRQHPDLRTSVALLDAAGERVSQARSAFLPSIGLDAVSSDSKDTQFGQPLDRTTRRTDAFVRWNLFHGMADAAGLRMTEQDSLAAEGDLADAHEKVAMQVTTAYVDVLRLRQRMELARDYVVDYQRLDDDVRKRVEAGRVPAAYQDQVRMGLIDAERQVYQLRGQLAGAEQHYVLLVGKAADEVSEPVLDDSAASQTLAAISEQLAVENNRVRAALARADARREEIGVAGAALFPSLNLEFRKRLQTDINPVPTSDTRGSTQVQLSYEMPLGGSSFSRKREAAARQEAAQATADGALLEVRTTLTQVWPQWIELRHIAPRLQERALASDKVVAAYDLQFTAGRRDLLDLVIVRGERFRARGDLIDNRMDQLLNSAQILALRGRLRAALLGDAVVAP